MPKGYIVAHIDVHDPELFAEFRKMSGAVLAEYGGKVLVGTPESDQREGSLNATTIIAEFPDVETAQRFYESRGYTEARAVRERAASTDLKIVEGFA